MFLWTVGGAEEGEQDDWPASNPRGFRAVPCSQFFSANPRSYANMVCVGRDERGAVGVGSVN